MRKRERKPLFVHAQYTKRAGFELRHTDNDSCSGRVQTLPSQSKPSPLDIDQVFCVRDGLHGNQLSTALYKRLLETHRNYKYFQNYVMDWIGARVIGTEDNKHQHWIKEAIEIRKRAPNPVFGIRWDGIWEFGAKKREEEKRGVRQMALPNPGRKRTLGFRNNWKQCNIQDVRKTERGEREEEKEGERVGGGPLLRPAVGNIWCGMRR
ncbi:hypothetical protein WMY93_033450 [Mugilogobius chulae]|uniref:Uncharacterized protein n=1 Tax=Mugilogobius chulae TaxID=88201 RepID=A0AAW0MH10_9GOBI